MQSTMHPSTFFYLLFICIFSSTTFLFGCEARKVEHLLVQRRPQSSVKHFVEHSTHSELVNYQKPLLQDNSPICINPPPAPPFRPPVVYPAPFAPPLALPRPPSPPAPVAASGGRLWCVAKPSVPDRILQEAMSYACGSGADCEFIQPNGSCNQPDTVISHASFAFNSYWQRMKVAGGTCDFDGTALLVPKDPSYSGCHYIII